MRVNNVRNAWKISHPDSATNRSFYDSSLWESKKLEGGEAVKDLIRKGVHNTSAVCVLIGTETWNRRWVRYEIARSLIDGRGLLGVHINGLKHHSRGTSDPLGVNPLSHIGVGKIVDPSDSSRARYYIYERKNDKWVRCSDHPSEISKPSWVTDPAVGHVRILSNDVSTYDYCLQEGHKNIGAWIDTAAAAAGR